MTISPRVQVRLELDLHRLKPVVLLHITRSWSTLGSHTLYQLSRGKLGRVPGKVRGSRGDVKPGRYRERQGGCNVGFAAAIRHNRD